MPQELQKTVKELTRKVSDVHSNLTLRRRTLRGVDMKFYRYQCDFEAVKSWLEDAETILEKEQDEERMKV